MRGTPHVRLAAANSIEVDSALFRRSSRPSHYFSARVALRIGAQRAISDRTKRSNAAGLRSDLAGIEPPSLARVSRTLGSSSALSRASASLTITSGGTPLGANSPAQTLIS